MVVAVFAVVAFGFAAIVVDLGYARSLKGHAQDAADSAALAGAAALFADGGVPDFDEAVLQAQINAQIEAMEPAYGRSCVDWSSADPGASLDVQIGCVSFDSADTIPRRFACDVPDIAVPSFFGGIFGYEDTGSRLRGGQPGTC